jgi:uncharacterized membrane protein
MESRAGIARHPIHPMLIPFPIALWIFSLASDLIYLFGFGGPLWKDIAFYSMVGGIAGALAAALPGYVDYRMLTEPQTVRIAWWHMVINLSLTLLFVVNALLRFETGPEALAPVLLSILGVGALGISGWLGGELVYVRGVGVEDRQPPSKPTATRQRVA